jgi:hypothetical protein
MARRSGLQRRIPRRAHFTFGACANPSRRSPDPCAILGDVPWRHPRRSVAGPRLLRLEAESSPNVVTLDSFGAPRGEPGLRTPPWGGSGLAPERPWPPPWGGPGPSAPGTGGALAYGGRPWLGGCPGPPQSGAGETSLLRDETRRAGENARNSHPVDEPVPLRASPRGGWDSETTSLYPEDAA